jgi:hypothetical protein
MTFLVRSSVSQSPFRVLLSRYRPLWPFLNWSLFGLGGIVIIGVMTGVFDYGGKGVGMGDGAAWYYAGTPYDWSDLPRGVAEYRYSPAFLWVTEPFRLLSFPIYQAVWVTLHFVAIAWLAPWMLAFPGVADDVITGNINTFLAVAVVFAVRGQSWTWSSVLLTKVTPGVGMLYHVGRREWKPLAVAAAVTAAIILIGIAFDRSIWQEWLDSLRAGPQTYKTVDVLAPLPVRLAAGAVLALLAVRWLWLLPIAMVLAMPGLWPASFALLAAIPRLRDTHQRQSGPQAAA